MMPLIEDYLKESLVARIEFLKKNPEYIQRIFGTLGKRSTLAGLNKYLLNNEIKTVIGFPREPNQVPCFVITLAGEQEVYNGLGDCTDEDLFYEEEDEFSPPDEEERPSISCVNMEATYRIEAWSDNGDLTAYMYTLAKWAMLVTRTEMISNGILLPKISAADLEPVPDYFPIFIYRRALMMSFQYENKYFENEMFYDPDIDTAIKDIKYKPHYYMSEE